MSKSFITDHVLLDALHVNRWTLAPFTQAGDWWRCEDSAMRSLGSGATPREAVANAIRATAERKP
jgi:hypothetical protein